MVTTPASPHARDIDSLLHPMTNIRQMEEEGPLILEEGPRLLRPRHRG